VASLTHGAEPFIRSRQLCSYSRTSRHFMEPEVSISCSQEPSTDPHPEPDQSNPIQSIPSHPIPSHPVSLRFILILSTYLRLGLRSGLFPSGLPNNILYALFFSHIHATCLARVILVLIILITLGEEYKLRSSSLCSFLRPPVTSSLFGPHILLSTLFSNTLSLCSSLNVRDNCKNT
jgi:hypothetical protein